MQFVNWLAESTICDPTVLPLTLLLMSNLMTWLLVITAPAHEHFSKIRVSFSLKHTQGRQEYYFLIFCPYSHSELVCHSAVHWQIMITVLDRSPWACMHCLWCTSLKIFNAMYLYLTYLLGIKIVLIREGQSPSYYQTVG